MENNGNDNPGISLEQVLHAGNGGNIPDGQSDGQGGQQGSQQGADPNKGDDPNKGKNTNQNNNQGQDPFKEFDAQNQNQNTEFDNIVNLLSENEDNLSDEDKGIRTEVFEVFKGKSVDSEGNILNDNNEVVFTNEQLQNYIDKGELPTDDEGNQINNLGEVIKTAEEVDSENSVVLEAQKSLKEALGIELVDENGKPLSYEDTNEGMISLVKDAVQHEKVNAVQSFLEGNPEINDVFKHLALGGDLKEYTSNNVDYKNVDLAKLDKSAKLSYIAQSYKKQGVRDPKAIMDLIEKAGDARLEQETANALLTLDGLQTEDKKQRDIQFKQKQQQEQQENLKYWNNIKQTIDKGQVENLTIPKHEREEFFNYMAKPADKEGRSRDQIAEDNEKQEFKLMVSYLRYKDYNINKLADLVGKEQRVKTLREKIRKQGSQVVSGQQTHNTNSGNNGSKVPIPSLEKLLGARR